MFQNGRHQEILEILKNERFASVQDLSRRLFASPPTIRRDLTALEKQGYVRRSHGGAILADDKAGIPVSFRSGRHMAEKLRICRVAATLISPASLIFTDASTTALHIADHVKDPDRITALTNGYLSCKHMSEQGIRVFSTGGRLLGDSLAFVGEIAAENVRRYNADIMFFSSSSLDERGMISDYSEEETELRLAMFRQASVRVFLCDSTKFGKRSAFNLCSLSDVDYVITGASLPQSAIRECGLHLISQTDAYLYQKEK